LAVAILEHDALVAAAAIRPELIERYPCKAAVSGFAVVTRSVPPRLQIGTADDATLSVPATETVAET
jgi:hypothetical protein